MKNEMYMLIGVPGSGKSWWTSYRCPLVNPVVLSSDAYIEEHARKINKTYNEIFRDHIDDAIKNTNLMCQKAIEEGKDIIWDQTNLDKKSRARKLARFSSKKYKKIAVYCHASHDDIFAVNEKRREFGRTIPEPVLLDMISRFEYPSLDEGFDDIIISVKR